MDGVLETGEDGLKVLPRGDFEVSDHDGQRILGGRAAARGVTPELDGLRLIHDLLLAQVSPNQQWGGLKAVQTKSGDILWLCQEHAEIQAPSPPEGI
jgi:hypothetical protein